MDAATHILLHVAAELPCSNRTLTAPDLERRVLTAARRLYGSLIPYAVSRQVKAALATAPAIRPGSSHSSYRTALVLQLV